MSVLHRLCMHCGMPARRYCQHDNCQLGVGYCSKACGFADSNIHELEHNHRDHELVRSRQLRCDNYTMDVQIKRSQDARAEFQEAMEQEAKRQKRPLTPEEQADFVFPRPPGSPGRGRRQKQKPRQQKRERSPKRTADPTLNDVQVRATAEKMKLFREMMRGLQEFAQLDAASRAEIEASFDRMNYHCLRITYGNLWRKPNLNKHLKALEREGTLLHRLFSKGEIQEMHEPTLEETAATMVEIHLENTATELRVSGPADFSWDEYDALYERDQETRPKIGVPYHPVRQEDIISAEELRKKVMLNNSRDLPESDKRSGKVVVAPSSMNGVPEDVRYVDAEELASRYAEIRALLLEPVTFPTFARTLQRWKRIDEIRASIPQKEWVLGEEFGDPLIPDYWVIDKDTKEISINKAALTTPPTEVVARYLKQALSFLDDTDAGVNLPVDIVLKAVEAIPSTKGKFAKALTAAKLTAMTVSAAVGMWGTYQAVKTAWTPEAGRSVLDRAEQAVEQAEIFAEANERAAMSNAETIDDMISAKNAELNLLRYLQTGDTLVPTLVAAENQPVPVVSSPASEAVKTAVAAVSFLPAQVGTMITAGEGSLSPTLKAKFAGMLTDRLEISAQFVTQQLMLQSKEGKAVSRDRFTQLVKTNIGGAFSDAVDSLIEENPGIANLQLPEDVIKSAWAGLVARTAEKLKNMETGNKSDTTGSKTRVMLGSFARLTEPARDYEVRHPMTHGIYQKYLNKGLSPKDARIYTSLEAGQTAEHEKLSNLAHDMMQEWELRGFRNANLQLLSSVLSLTVVAATMGAFSVAAGVAFAGYTFRSYNWVVWLKRWMNGETAPDQMEKEVLDDYPPREGIKASDAIKLRKKIREFKVKLRSGDWTYAQYLEHLRNMTQIYGWKPVVMNPMQSKFADFKRITFALGVGWAVQSQIWQVAGYLGSMAINYISGLSPMESFGAATVLAGASFSLGATVFGASNLKRAAKTSFGIFFGLPLAIASELLKEDSKLTNVVDLYLSVYTAWKGVNTLQHAAGFQSLDEWVLEKAADFNDPTLNTLLGGYNDFLVKAQTGGIAPSERFTTGEVQRSRAIGQAVGQRILEKISSQPPEIRAKAEELMRPLALDQAWKQSRSAEESTTSAFFAAASFRQMMKSLADTKNDRQIAAQLGVDALYDNAFLGVYFPGDELKQFADTLTQYVNE